MRSSVENQGPRRKKTAPAAAPARRIIVEFPAALLKRTDQAAAQRSTNRSQLIRRAVERLLDRLEHEQLAQELAAGYRANAARDRQICEEFGQVDAENL